MICPYCNRQVYGMTGLQEIDAFRKHLPKCRKNPNNEVVGKKVFPRKFEGITDALRIREESGQ